MRLALTSQGATLAGSRNPHRCALLLGCMAVSLLGCAVPGVPVTRHFAKLPQIRDLSGKQVGNSVVLSFTLPEKSASGYTPENGIGVQIYRVFESRTKPARRAKPRLVAAIPPQMIGRYSERGHVVLSETISPQQLIAQAGNRTAVYAVRTQVGRIHSERSNLFRIPILPAPQPIHDLRAQVQGTAAELSWSTPAILPRNSLHPTSLHYAIYRAAFPETGSESSPSAGPFTVPASSATPATSFEFLADSPVASYRDTTLKPKRIYEYTVRSIVQYAPGSVESENSNVIEAMLPAIPQLAAPSKVIASITPGKRTAAFVAELSWAISREADLAGYNVYRSTIEANIGVRLNSAPVPVPVFQDTSVVPEQQYFYRITAVSRTGKESEPSSPIRVKVPASN